MRKDIRSSTGPEALAAPFPLPSPGDAMADHMRQARANSTLDTIMKAA